MYMFVYIQALSLNARILAVAPSTYVHFVVFISVGMPPATPIVGVYRMTGLGQPTHSHMYSFEGVPKAAEEVGRGFAIE